MNFNRSLYSVPTMRPCSAIEPEASGGIRVELEERYAALTHPLALDGSAAMSLTNDGDVVLLKALRANFPWMEGVIAVLEQQIRLAIWAGQPWLAWKPICLVGDPGTGKSHFARELASMGGLAFAALDVGSMNDSAAITAVSRGWTNTKPCWPAQMMEAFRTANPLLVLEEIEKAGGSERNGEPHKALLSMLEPSTAAHYFDTCLMAEVDLSAVCWIATANSVQNLPRPLASRMHIIPVPRPDPEHFDLVIAGLLRDLADNWQLPFDYLPAMPAEALRVLRQTFVRHRSVRLLKRHLETVVAAILPTRRSPLH